MQRLRIKSVLASLLVFSLFVLHFLPAYVGMKASFLSSQFLAELESSQQRECEPVLLLKSVDMLLKKSPITRRGGRGRKEILPFHAETFVGCN